MILETNLNKFFDKIGIVRTRVKDVMVIGGGKIKYYLAEQLKHMGISIKIIERDWDRCEELSAAFPKAIVIYVDGTEEDILLEEGIANTEAFVALTDLDEENIMLSLYAQCKCDAKLITKINNITFNEVINSLDIESIIDSKYIMANSILSYIRGMQNLFGSNVETLYKIVDNKAEVFQASSIVTTTDFERFVYIN